jgi:hypothetical protein
MVGVAFHPHSLASLDLHQQTAAHSAIRALGAPPLGGYAVCVVKKCSRTLGLGA